MIDRFKDFAGEVVGELKSIVQDSEMTGLI
jgi:hypothetical protein